MLPKKNDPRWIKVIKNIKSYDFKNLPTKMLMMRLYLIAQDGTSQKTAMAIEVAHDFFSKNSHIVSDDIELLFGNENKNA